MGVTRVFYGKDFISVTKKEEEDWKILKPEVLSVITEHYTRGQPLLLEDVVEPEVLDPALAVVRGHRQAEVFSPALKRMDQHILTL